MREKAPFHLALKVWDLDKARDFYAGLLGAREMRKTGLWADFWFYGAQLTLHLRPKSETESASRNLVDGLSVPIPHFGPILPIAEFERLSARLEKEGAPFAIPPQTRFAGRPEEQRTMFLQDPFGHFIEFKAWTGKPEY